MIHCLFANDMAREAEIITRAMRRSFTRGQVRVWTGDLPDLETGSIVVAIAPSDNNYEYFRALAARRTKLIFFGPIGPALAALAGLSIAPIPPDCTDLATCSPATPNEFSESNAAIRYSDTGLGVSSPLSERRLCRFDFADEWNNLGYGRIGIGDDLWSIGVTAEISSATAVAELIHVPQLSRRIVATVRDLPSSAVFWHARTVGPVDGADWRVIEVFISDYRQAELPCRPFLRDIPHGVAAAVTMRLDCDEDIASSRPLFDLYRQLGVPLSLAIKTDQDERSEHLAMLSDLQAAGGSILSHSVSHAPNWGGSAEAAEAEASGSKAWLESHVRDLSVNYAVSPFHQNPSYVPGALSRAGYNGFIGGIIANDPEYLMARGGEVPYGPDGFISHSQSCMLHGDCILTDGDPLRIYKQAFRIAQAGSQFFGYLDHPFSPRYAYGWKSESDRLSRHADLIADIRQHCQDLEGSLLFVNEEVCLNFMRDKSLTNIQYDGAQDRFTVSSTHAAELPLSLGFRGRVMAASNV